MPAPRSLTLPRPSLKAGVTALASGLLLLAAPAAQAACDPGLAFRRFAVCVAAEQEAQAAINASLQDSLAATQVELADTQAELAAANAEVESLRDDLDGLLGAGLATQAWVLAQDFAVAINPTLSALAGYLQVDEAQHAVHFVGANVYVTNGMSETDTQNGLGNLVVGYSEARGNEDRTGSHNVVIGQYHDWTSYGGLVAGQENSIIGAGATVSGGYDNTASGMYSSVCGGLANLASETLSSVNGGFYNEASGQWSSVSGGYFNESSGEMSSVSGGEYNVASGLGSSVGGGRANDAAGEDSSVSGGYFNVASGSRSSVCGGESNHSSGALSSILGGAWNETLGSWETYPAGP